MKSKGIKVCMISCTHGLEDDRIYWKECLSLSKEGYDVIHLGVGNENIQYTCNNGIQLIQLKKEATTLLGRYQFYNTILKTAAQLQAAVYHLHDWQLHTIAKSLKNLPWKPKVVYDAHESTTFLLEQDIIDKQWTGLKKIAYQLKAKYAGKWEKKKVATYHAIITAEEYVLSTFKAKKNQLQQVIHNFSFFTAPIRATVEKKFDIVYAGLLAPNRGIISLITSIAICKKKNVTVRLLLVGPFYDVGFEKEVKDTIAHFQLEQAITLLPAILYSEVPLYLQQSKIGACTWLLTDKNRQAIPIKLFEYMAYGLPVIFSHQCYASTYVAENNCGCLVNPSAPDDIAKTILQLLKDPEKYRTYSENAKLAIVSKYNWPNEATLLIQLYKQMLS